MILPNHLSPVVFHSIIYNVGGIDETPEHAGVAHFLEHMMFKGSEKYPEGYKATYKNMLNNMVAT
ncbi:MAG: insulinase family protein [Alphaproteobacteria bacterium]